MPCAITNFRNQGHLSLPCLQGGQTPMMAAARNGHFDVVNTLLELGASVGATDEVSYHQCFLYTDHGIVYKAVSIPCTHATAARQLRHGHIVPLDSKPARLLSIRFAISYLPGIHILGSCSIVSPTMQFSNHLHVLL